MPDSDSRIDVSGVLAERGAEMSITGRYDLRVLAVGEYDYEIVEPASFTVDIVNCGEGLVMTGHIDAKLRAQCSRCLRDFDLGVSADVEGFFVRPGDEGGLPEEQDYFVIDGYVADARPALEGALAVEVPYAPLHDPACRGLCPVCGADLNEGPCACGKEPGTGEDPAED